MISIVDDDESARDSTKILLRSAGYEVTAFESAQLYLDSGAVVETECLVLDILMPGMDGLELQHRLNATSFSAPIVFVTGVFDLTSQRQAIEAGAAEFLCKPCDASVLVAAVQNALVRRKVGRQGS